MEALLDFFDQTEPQLSPSNKASGGQQDPLPSSLPPEVSSFLLLFVDTSV